MLIGLIPVTSGIAFINGLDVVNEMTEIRKNIGYCPQHDVLIPEMTVEEHLFMYARIKGCKEEVVVREINQILDSIRLQSKRKEKIVNLSGGQKRKLSLGIAFIGGSKVIFLGQLNYYRALFLALIDRISIL